MRVLICQLVVSGVGKGKPDRLENLEKQDQEGGSTGGGGQRREGKQDDTGERMREQLRKWLFWSYSRWDVSGGFRPIRAICDPAFVEKMENTEEALALYASKATCPPGCHYAYGHKG